MKANNFLNELFLSDRARFGLTLFGIVAAYVLVSPIIAEAAQGSPSEACNRLVASMEGSFGALVAAAAGVAAILAAAMGGFKAAWALLVVSVGAFILRSYLTLYNNACAGGGGFI